MLKVVIIGGGLAGFSAAIAMALSGHAVTLLEAQEELKEVGDHVPKVECLRFPRSGEL